MTVIGWDIGGVNLKVARVEEGRVRQAITFPFEVQRDPAALVPAIASLARRVEAGAGATHALTMTAELSQSFRTKSEGVAFVVAAAESALAPSMPRIFAVDGRFLDPRAARAEPLSVAASNWAASARLVARTWSDAVFIDIGSTTTDIIPIAGGRVVARGRTDPERLTTGELLYLGALRTPVEAIVHEVPLGTGVAGVSAEGFAVAGDVHLWRGDLQPADFTVPTPDGRPATREFARERLARVVCADRDTLDDAGVDAIAAAVAEATVKRVAAAIQRVRRSAPTASLAVVAGAGAFLAARAAERAGMRVEHLARTLGPDAARAAPAAAVAILLELTGHR